MLRIAGIQFDIAWEDPDENFRRAETLIHRAAAADAQLIVLPEMFATGFSMQAQKVAAVGERTRTFLRRLADELRVWILGGYAELGQDESEKPRNACSLFDPSGGEALRYHKIHPFSLAGEDRHYAAGQSIASATIEGVRVTPLICYDLRFPEPFRAAALATDCFVVIANWPQVRSAAWSALLRARAIENQAFVLGVNRVGDAEETPHDGCSALIDPLGNALATAAHQEHVLTGTVDARQVESCRRRFSFLADRKPGVYAKLS